MKRSEGPPPTADRSAVLEVALLGFGSRKWTSEGPVRSIFDLFLPRRVVQGCARGADSLFARVARERSIHVDPFPIDARYDGRTREAPNRRNQRQLDRGRPTIAAGCVVDFLGEPLTGGSFDMLERLLLAQVRTLLVRQDGAIWVERIDSGKRLAFGAAEPRILVKSGTADRSAVGLGGRSGTMSFEDLCEYARLLRRSWISPEVDAWRQAVIDFERDHREVEKFLRDWQKLS